MSERTPVLEMTSSSDTEKQIIGIFEKIEDLTVKFDSLKTENEVINGKYVELSNRYVELKGRHDNLLKLHQNVDVPTHHSP